MQHYTKQCRWRRDRLSNTVGRSVPCAGCGTVESTATGANAFGRVVQQDAEESGRPFESCWSGEADGELSPVGKQAMFLYAYEIAMVGANSVDGCMTDVWVERQ